MQNISLVGLTGGTNPAELFKVNANGQQEKGKSSDFLTLFKSQIIMGTQHDSEITQTQQTKDASRQNTLNPWSDVKANAVKAREKLGAKEKTEGVETDLEVAAHDKSFKQKDSVRISDKDKEIVEEEIISQEAESSKQSVSNEVWAMLEAEPEIQEMVKQLSDEEKAILFEILGSIDSQELKALAEAPEALVVELVKAVEQLPESAETKNLVEMLSSEEFSAMLSQLATAMASIEETTSEKNLPETDLPETKRVSDKSTPAHETDLSEKSEDKLAETNLEKAAEDSSKIEPKKEKDEKEDKGNVVENVNSKATHEHAVAKNLRFSADTESLRNSFRRENQDYSAEASQIESEQSARSETQLEPTAQTVLKSDLSTIENKLTTFDGIAKKLISSLLNKSGDAVGKKAAFTFNPTSLSNQSSSHSNNNAGNGFSNGFYQNQTYTSQASVKQPVMANNSLFLSQLLDKAEMFKTSDGKKVLSLEMDPKELGKMEMELTSKDGTVTAKISAESELAKARLEELAPQIKEQLSTQGINLTEITVDISSRHPDERNDQQMAEEKNKSNKTDKIDVGKAEQIIRKNILPNLRKTAFNIQSVDLTV